MDNNLLTRFQHHLNSDTTASSSNNSQKLPRKSLLIALSLIRNTTTTPSVLSSLQDLLHDVLQHDHHSHHILTLLNSLYRYHPNLPRRPISSTATLSDPKDQVQASLLSNPTTSTCKESLFLSLCFGSNDISLRVWLLRNFDIFDVRPSVLLTLLLGFTKDPYPYVRQAALNGLVHLSLCSVISDEGLIQGCYFRAVELLFDAEDSVRCSAVRAVSGWGNLLVQSRENQSKRDWSDALFVQLCSMVRDMSVKVRVETFDALGKIDMVSESILLQTLSKKVLPSTKEMKYPGQYTAKLFSLPISTSAFAFAHGLEDEYHEVRLSACRSLSLLAVLSISFAVEVLNLLVDVLNDDSTVVRLEALKTMHDMAIFDHLKLQESHMHMFLGTLTDNNASVRIAARKILQLAKIQNIAMFKLSVDVLIKNLEVYPQDEPEVLFTLFCFGQSHGKFVISVINKASQEIEPSFDGKLRFDKPRTIALLALAISAPVSVERHVCSIPPRIFSYAVTLLGRLSHGLADLMNQNSLLANLSCFSRYKFVSASEFFSENRIDMPVIEGNELLKQQTDASCMLRTVGEKLKVTSGVVDCQLGFQEESNSYMKSILQKVKELWPLVRLGCMDVVRKTLRTWKEELSCLGTDLPQSAGGIIFASHYLCVIELLGQVWANFLSSTKLFSCGMVESSVILDKLDRKLRDLSNRFTGLGYREELYILELSLFSCMLRFVYVETCYNRTMLEKLFSAISHIEHLSEEVSVEISGFVVGLKNTLANIYDSKNWPLENPYLLQKSLDDFSLRHFVLSGEVKYKEAKLNIQDNSLHNPLPFVSGFPVGIPLEITLHNILNERLWVRMLLSNEISEFIFLDLVHVRYAENNKFKFVAPFYRTPKVRYFSLKVSICMECLSEDVPLSKNCQGPSHELTCLCEETEVHFSMVGK